MFYREKFHKSNIGKIGFLVTYVVSMSTFGIVNTRTRFKTRDCQTSQLLNFFKMFFLPKMYKYMEMELRHKARTVVKL